MFVTKHVLLHLWSLKVLSDGQQHYYESLPGNPQVAFVAKDAHEIYLYVLSIQIQHFIH
jgi:hypothetical protein